MDSKTWRDLSYIFLTSGVVFFIITLILSMKFQLVSMIRAELNHKKQNKTYDNRDYFAYVENKNRNNAEAINSSGNSSYTERTSAIKKNVPQQTLPDETPATVVISSAGKNVDPNNTDATVITRRNNNSENSNDEFIITENIIVIHGDPDIVSV